MTFCERFTSVHMNFQLIIDSSTLSISELWQEQKCLEEILVNAHKNCGPRLRGFRQQAGMVVVSLQSNG